MNCLHCHKQVDTSTWELWASAMTKGLSKQDPNPYLYCSRCYPGEKDRCIVCGLHWPVSRIFKRTCQVCRENPPKKPKTKRGGTYLPQSRFSKLYKET